MKLERIRKMMPVMFIAYSVGMFALCGIILGNGKDEAGAVYSERTVDSEYAIRY